jgi:7,8-dihydropterin-6-yl-methyl-4-(beta-D-ribofuranosyl)aminobenzene 5'-phosphate synthase
MGTIKLTIIIDDLNGAEPGYLKSFGFSLLIEVDHQKVLFDTGTKKKILLKNLVNYGVKPSEINAVILSHNHYDHTNGLSGILKHNPDVPVYVHKYWKKPVKKIGDSFPHKNMIFVEKGGVIREIGNNIYNTNAYMSPDYGGIYEQACYIKAKDSFILICGCCHPGLNNFLGDREFLGIPDKSPLHIIGGFHGFKFDDENAHLLNRYLQSIVVCHCTKNIKVYKGQFREQCFIGTVGKTLKFDI